MKVYLKRDPTRNWLLWWGTSPENIRYPIPEKRVQAALDPEPRSLDEKLKAYREKLNRIYRGTVEEFQGVYSREEKTLTLKA
jgi:hypothetical protein